MPPLESFYDIPLEPNPNNACALCCYTMVSHYFFPQEHTLESMGKIAKWHPGYVVWEFPFFNWFLNRGGEIAYWDNIPLAVWAEEGFDALANHLPAEEFNYFKRNTKNPDTIRADLKTALHHPQLHFHQQKPTMEDLQSLFNKGYLCAVVLNYAPISARPGLALHQVLVIDITASDVVLHNPLAPEEAKPAQKIPLDLFKEAWLKATECPSLYGYRMP